MKQITFIAIAIFIATIMTACGQTSRYVPEGWKKFETHEFSVLYPETFELTSGVMPGARFMLVAPRTSPDDISRVNINLNIQDFRGVDASLIDFVEFNERQITQIATDVYFIESRIVTTEEFEYHLIVFTFRQGLFNIKMMQRFMLKNEIAYTLTYTAMEEQFDNYIEIATKIMDSFKIK